MSSKPSFTGNFLSDQHHLRDKSLHSSNPDISFEEQDDHFVSDESPIEKTPFLTIPKSKMNTLFIKLASNGHLRTLKDKSINPESLMSKEIKTLDSKIDIDEFINNDPNLLLTETCISRSNPLSSPPAKKDENAPSSSNKQSDFSISFRMQSNDKSNKKDYEKQRPLSLSTQFNLVDEKEENNGVSSSSNIEKCNANEAKNRSVCKTPMPMVNSYTGGTMTPHGSFVKKSSLNFNNKTNQGKNNMSNRTPTKNTMVNKVGTSNGTTTKKQVVRTSNSKQDMLKSSNNNTSSKVVTKRKVNSPSISMMSSKRTTLNTANVNSSFSKSNANSYINGGTDMNTIEEYDYNKILLDLKAIFGDNLEYFDENLLFESLDEASNKGLIKGLLMLSYFQEKKLRFLNENIDQMKSQHKNELVTKETIIDELSTDLSNINSSLKGLIIDTDKYAKKNPTDTNVNGINLRPSTLKK